MSSGVRDLTSGNLWKDIFRFSVPLIITNLMQILFNIADIAVVGRFAGPLPMGAVGCTSMLVFLFIGVLMGLGAGVNVITARAMGEKNPQKISRTVHTAFLLCLLAGFTVLLLGEGFHRPILRILNTKEELFESASLYCKIYLTGLPALAVYNFGNAVYSAAGDTRKPLVFLLISGILNVILNLIFVIGFGMDVDGVGAASAISEYVSALCVIISLFLADGPHRLKGARMRIDPEILVGILSVGVPAALQNSVFAMANLSLQFGINSLSTAMVAGDAAAKNSDTLIYTVMDSFYVACGSFMGQNFGAGDRGRVLKSYRVSMTYAFAAGALLGGLLLVFGEQFLSFFTSDREVILCGMQRIRIMGLSYAFSALMDCTIAACRALGKGAVPTVIVLIGSCLYRFLWVAIVFRHYRTIPSLYLVFITSWLLTAAAEYLYFRKITRELLSN